MTDDEFDKLDENAKAYFLFASGTYIATQVDKEQYILLYQLDDFYVEIFHNLEDNSVQMIKSFSDIDNLNPYLEQLNIHGFL